MMVDSKKNMVGAWKQCRGECELCEYYPNLMKLCWIVVELIAKTVVEKDDIDFLRHFEVHDLRNLDRNENMKTCFSR